MRRREWGTTGPEALIGGFLWTLVILGLPALAMSVISG